MCAWGKIVVTGDNNVTQYKGIKFSSDILTNTENLPNSIITDENSDTHDIENNVFSMYMENSLNTEDLPHTSNISTNTEDNINTEDIANTSVIPKNTTLRGPRVIHRKYSEYISNSQERYFEAIKSICKKSKNKAVISTYIELADVWLK